MQCLESLIEMDKNTIYKMVYANWSNDQNMATGIKFRKMYTFAHLTWDVDVEYNTDVQNLIGNNYVDVLCTI